MEPTGSARAMPDAGMTKADYIQTVLETIAEFEANPVYGKQMHTRLILSVSAGLPLSTSHPVYYTSHHISNTTLTHPYPNISSRKSQIDRRNTLSQALEVVALAQRFQSSGVVGLDLCGDPSMQGIEALAPAFLAARGLTFISNTPNTPNSIIKTHGNSNANNGTVKDKETEPGPQGRLGLTLHFAEAETSASEQELALLLAWQPDRIGHVIHVSPAAREGIISRGGMGLELCLSCNVHAGMVCGGFEGQ